LALIGSAASDIAGFSVIALSPMGLFSNFGIYSAAMIALSLFASLVLTTAALGILATLMRDNSALKAVFVESE
jgi:predicted RND superfamily exporter protein